MRRRAGAGRIPGRFAGGDGPESFGSYGPPPTPSRARAWCPDIPGARVVSGPGNGWAGRRAPKDGLLSVREAGGGLALAGGRVKVCRAVRPEPTSNEQLRRPSLSFPRWRCPSRKGTPRPVVIRPGVALGAPSGRSLHGPGAGPVWSCTGLPALLHQPACRESSPKVEGGWAVAGRGARGLPWRSRAYADWRHLTGNCDEPVPGPALGATAVGPGLMLRTAGRSEPGWRRVRGQPGPT